MKNRIRELRERKKWSLPVFSDNLKKITGVELTPDAISKYERGDRNPSTDKVKAMASMFEVTPDYLMGYGYPKEYLVDLLKEAYIENFKIKAGFPSPFPTEPEPTIDAIPSVNEYLKIPDDDFHQEVANQSRNWWLEQFSSIFAEPGIERLLTTHDKLSDDVLKSLMIVEVERATLPKLVTLKLKYSDELATLIAKASNKKVSANELKGKTIIINFD